MPSKRGRRGGSPAATPGTPTPLPAFNSVQARRHVRVQCAPRRGVPCWWHQPRGGDVEAMPAQLTTPLHFAGTHHRGAAEAAIVSPHRGLGAGAYNIGRGGSKHSHMTVSGAPLACMLLQQEAKKRQRTRGRYKVRPGPGRPDFFDTRGLSRPNTSPLPALEVGLPSMSQSTPNLWAGGRGSPDGAGRVSRVSRAVVVALWCMRLLMHLLMHCLARVHNETTRAASTPQLVPLGPSRRRAM